MPAGNASMDGELHDLYAQARAARMQARILAGKLQAARRKTQENCQAIRDTWDRAEQIRAGRPTAITDAGLLRYSAYARLQARLASLPVIEQAKGIIIAKSGSSADQAFEALRRASQRENIKVRDLAAAVVAGAVRSASASRPASPPRLARRLTAVARGQELDEAVEPVAARTTDSCDFEHAAG